jgi:hypothetical protein
VGEFDPKDLDIGGEPQPGPPGNGGGGKRKPKAEHSPGGDWLPVQVKARLNGVPPGPALNVLHAIIGLEFKKRTAWSGGVLTLTKAVAAFWGVSRSRQKLAGLDELARRGILTYTCEHGKNPKVTLEKHLWG